MYLKLTKKFISAWVEPFKALLVHFETIKEIGVVSITWLFH